MTNWERKLIKEIWGIHAIINCNAGLNVLGETIVEFPYK